AQTQRRFSGLSNGERSSANRRQERVREEPRARCPQHVGALGEWRVGEREAKRLREGWNGWGAAAARRGCPFRSAWRELARAAWRELARSAWRRLVRSAWAHLVRSA